MRNTAYAPPSENRLRKRLFELGLGRADAPRLIRPFRNAAWSAFISLLVLQNPRVKGQRLEALRTFWRCQLMRRKSITYVADMGPSGKILCPPWSALACVTAATGAHEPSEQSFVEAFVRAGDGIIDAGASLGFYAIPLGMRGAFVSSFEPAELTRGVLEANVTLNGLGDNVRVFAEALSDYNGEGFITEGLDVENHLVDTPGTSEAGQRIEVRTLSSVIEEHPGWFSPHHVALLKIDVEGQDLQVLAGAKRVIETHRPVLMIETRQGGAETRRALASMGYVCHWYDEARRHLVEFPDDWRGNYQFHTNVIAVPQEKLDWTAKRLAGAAPPRHGVPRIAATDIVFG